MGRKDYRNSNSGLEEFERFARGKVGKENHQNNSSVHISKERRLKDITISSGNSSESRKKSLNDSSKVEEIGKLLKNNFFVDGEKLLRHMSPEVKNESI